MSLRTSATGQIVVTFDFRVDEIYLDGDRVAVSISRGDAAPEGLIFYRGEVVKIQQTITIDDKAAPTVTEALQIIKEALK